MLPGLTYDGLPCATAPAELGLCAPFPTPLPRAFAFNQSLERLVEQHRYVAQPASRLSFRKQLVIDLDRNAHRQLKA